MANVFSVVNGAAGNAAAPVKVATINGIKTMIQLSPPATKPLKIIQWWCEFDASAAAAPVTVELLHTTAVPATGLTAYVAADITKVSVPDPATTSSITLGTGNSGFWTAAAAEGTVTAGVQYETHFVPPTGGIFIQYPLGREPIVPVSTFCRIRVTSTVVYNCYCGIQWEE